jgi:hypothetical protein
VLSFRVSNQNIVCTSLFSLMHATCLSYFILIYWVILIIFDGVYTWWSSSLCSVSHSPIISSLWWHFSISVFPLLKLTSDYLLLLQIRSFI